MCPLEKKYDGFGGQSLAVGGRTVVSKILWGGWVGESYCRDIWE